MFGQLLTLVEVRQNNGQCDYGPWIPVADVDMPVWVGGMIASVIAEYDADSGLVEQGGSRWSWRKA